jgi:tetratricopeptide (TPR) repeat protein
VATLRRLMSEHGEDEVVKFRAAQNAGDYCRVAGRFEQAHAAFQELIDSRSRQFAVMGWVGTGRTFASEGRFSKAREVFERIIDVYQDLPRNRAQALTSLGTLLAEIDERDAALAVLDRVHTEHRDITGMRALALIIAGDMWRRAEEFWRADEAYRACKERYPATRQARDAQLWTGLLLLRTGDGPGAVTCFSELGCRSRAEATEWKPTWFNRLDWGLALQGDPGADVWLKDEQGTAMTPGEALRRTMAGERGAFQDMLDFRASFDSDWEKFSQRED